MDELKELEYKVHSMKVYIYTTCTQELEDIEKIKITDEEVLDIFLKEYHAWQRMTGFIIFATN